MVLTIASSFATGDPWRDPDARRFLDMNKTERRKQYKCKRVVELSEIKDLVEDYKNRKTADRQKKGKNQKDKQGDLLCMFRLYYV